MRLLVLPISGGSFVNQLAILSLLTLTFYQPEIIFASSGGNVAAYTAVAGEWSWAGLQRVAGEINSRMFASPWSPLPPLAFIQAYSKGYMFQQGKGVKDFFATYFTPESMDQIEIWTGAQELETQKAALFCNRCESILNLDFFNHHLLNSQPPFFCQSNVELISLASTASASIPSVVPPVKINDHNYVDGGVCSASPMHLLAETVLQTCEEQDSDCKIFYISPCNLYDQQEYSPGNLVQNSKQAARDIVRSKIVLDRVSGYQVVARLAKNKLQTRHFILDERTIQEVISLSDQYPYVFIEFYPLNPQELDIFKFDGPKVISTLIQVEKQLECYVWYGERS